MLKQPANLKPFRQRYHSDGSVLYDFHSQYIFCNVHCLNPNTGPRFCLYQPDPFHFNITLITLCPIITRQNAQERIYKCGLSWRFTMLPRRRRMQFHHLLFEYISQISYTHEHSVCLDYNW